MTREEVKYASKDYVNYLLDKQEYHNENYTEDDIRQAFEKGTIFANNNPDISSFWHNASEEPKRDSLILLIMQSGTAIVAKIIEPNHTFNHGERWAYITDILPKEQEIKL